MACLLTVLSLYERAISYGLKFITVGLGRKKSFMHDMFKYQLLNFDKHLLYAKISWILLIQITQLALLKCLMDL